VTNTCDKVKEFLRYINIGEFLEHVSVIQNYNFACCSVWMLKLISGIKGGTKTEGV
jgi:hypothetical protein